MKTILVVDDFASVRLYHCHFLTQKGFRCVEARNGSEAFRVLGRGEIDLVLLDLVMPDMDGAAFLAQLRASPAHRNLPVIAITSEALKAETLQLRRTYGLKLRLKPLLPEQLFRDVQETLEGRGA